MALAKLSVGDFGDDVALLQKQLTQSGLDVSAQEAKRKLFGPATRNAVTEYQKKNGLPATGEVDVATSASLSIAAPSIVGSPVPAAVSLVAPPPLTASSPVNGKPATQPVALPAGTAAQPAAPPAGGLFVVRGQVRQPDGSPLAEAIVQAFDQDMRTQEKLGEGRTSVAGQYEIRYTAEQFSRDEKKSADLVVRVVDAKGQQLAASTVKFNAAPETTINLTVAGDYRPLPEIEQLVAEITPVAQAVAAADFTTDDIAFLAGETGMDRRHIELLSIASQHSRKTSVVSTEVFYGLLRQIRQTDLLGLLANNPRDLRRALETSLRDNIIPIRLEGELDSILAALNQLLLQYALQPADKGGSPTLGDLLGTSTLTRNQQERFLTLNASRDGSSDDFWNTLRQDPAFKATGAVDDLQLTLQLGALTQSNVPLVKALQTLRQRGTVKSLSDLVKLDSNAWIQLLNTRVNGQPISIPDAIAGATPEERRTTYISGMTASLRAAFPTAAAAQRVAIPPVIDLGLVRAVLARNPGFNPGDLVPDSFDWAGIKNGDRARTESSLEALRQEIKTFPGFDYKAWLAQTGAPAVSSGASPAVLNPVRDGVSTFLSNSSDFDLHTTHVDSYIAANATALQGVRDEHKSAVIDQLKRTQRVFRVTPNYDQVSGLMAAGLHSAYGIATMPRNAFIQTFQDKWDGREASTVHSRARTATAGTTTFSAQVSGALNGVTPQVVGQTSNRTLEVIKKRLPNWENLFRSTSFCECGHCRSVYGPAAYFVDLLQFLQSSGKWPNFTLDPPPNQFPLKVLLRRRPDLEYIKLTCENAETPLPYIDLVNEILETYAFLGMLDQSAAHDTGDTTADELSANPQYLNEGAYDKLKKAVYPLSLPFNRPLEVERTYLEHLGASRHDLMKTFQNDGSPSDLAIACEDSRISEEEYEILTGTHLNGAALQSPRKLPEFYGYNATTTTSTLTANLQPVPEFLRRTGITYLDLIELVKTRFLNPAQAITLSVPADADQCDLSQTTINPLDAVTLQNIHRFIRLWRKLGWQVQELDKAILALGAADIDDSLLLKLAQVKRLQSDFNLPLDQLLSFWAGIDANGRDCLYIRLFQNNGVLKPVDAAFELTYVASLASLQGIALPNALKDQISYNAASKQLRFDGAMTDSQREDLMALSDAAEFQLAVDKLYQMRWPASIELATPGQFLSEHVNTILAGLRLSANGLASIRTATGLADLNVNKLTPLSLANLSVIYRHAVLAKALRLSVDDCLALIELTGIDPFQQGEPASTAFFVDKARNARQSAFSVLQLNYLYRDIADPNGRITPPQLSIDLLMIALQNGLRKIIDDAAILSDPTGDTLGQTLAIVLDAAMVDPVMKQLDGTDAYSAALADTLAPFLDEPVAAVAQLITDTSLLPANRFDHVLQRLTAHLDSRNFITQTLSSNLKLDVKLAEMLVTGGVGQTTVALLKSRTDATQPIVADFLTLTTLLPYGPAPLPSDPTTNSAKEAYRLLHKVVLLINTFKMTTDEVLYLSAHGSDFSGADPADPNNNAKSLPFDLNSLPLDSTGFKPALFNQWERLNALFALRDSLPQGEVGLLDVFAASSLDDAKAKLVSATGWDSAELDTLTGQTGFQLTAGDFKNEIQMVRLQACWTRIERLEVSATQLFDWATADATPPQAQSIQATAKAKYDDQTWLTIAKPLNDVLRDRQRAALIAYVLTDPTIQAAGITDSNRLYEYFLIDVEMGPCMMTSRIVQANASVQLFVQRCLMNLEEGKADPTQDVSPWAIDANHWQWMSQYRVWEANRKVFLYPENWILPELRDNKSPFFAELESELLQNDLTEDTAEEAIMNYLEKLDQVGRLEICGMYWQKDEEPDPLTGEASEFLHVFGRTSNVPHVYFYRSLAMATSVWTAWEKVPVDIQGDHLVPLVWNHHLYIFWPTFEEKSDDDQLSGATWVESTEHWQWRKCHEAWKKKDVIWTMIHNSWTTMNSLDQQSPGNNLADTAVHYYNTSPDTESYRATLPNFDPQNEPKEPPEPSAAAQPTLTHWEIKLSWSEYKHGNWSAKQTSAEVVPSPSLIQLLSDVLDRAGVKEEDRRPLYLPQLSDPPAVPPIDPIAQLYLPSPEEHFLKTRTDKGQVIIAVYRRYSTGFPLFDHSLSSSFEGYECLGYFRTACGTKIKAIASDPDVPDPNCPQHLDFSSLACPYLAANSFMTLEGSTHICNLDASLGDARLVLGKIPDSQFTLVVEHQVGQFALSPPFQTFVYQDRDKTYCVRPAGWIGYQLQLCTFYHPQICMFIEALNQGGTPNLLTLTNQQLSDPIPLSKYYAPLSSLIVKPYPSENVDFSPSGAYSLYNWELFFHIPLLIATRLSQNQKFEEAQRWLHYIFNPTDNSAEAPPKCFWKVLPFHDNAEDERIQDLLKLLDYQGTDPEILGQKSNFEEQVTEWQNRPFNPHLIARLRLIAYQKTVVMKYIDNLIAWGDYLFSQDTMESVNQAIQLYVLASDILGPRPQQVPERGSVQIQTYHDLKSTLDSFSNALVDLENEFPFTTSPAASPLQLTLAASSQMVLI